VCAHLRACVRLAINFMLHHATLISCPLIPDAATTQVNELTSLWMLSTFLDDTLRISRDDQVRLG